MNWLSGRSRSQGLPHSRIRRGRGIAASIGSKLLELVRAAARCQGNRPQPYLRRCIRGALQHQLRDRALLVRLPGRQRGTVPPDQAAAVLLTLLEGMSLRAAAAQLGVLREGVGQATPASQRQEWEYRSRTAALKESNGGNEQKRRALSECSVAELDTATQAAAHAIRSGGPEEGQRAWNGGRRRGQDLRIRVSCKEVKLSKIFNLFSVKNVECCANGLPCKSGKVRTDYGIEYIWSTEFIADCSRKLPGQLFTPPPRHCTSILWGIEFFEVIEWVPLECSDIVISATDVDDKRLGLARAKS